MRRARPPYVLLLMIAPLVGIGVSRIAASFNDPSLGDNQCVEPSASFPPFKRTSILPQLKYPKYFPAAWKRSKRRGIRAVVTTLYNVHLHEALPILDGQRPPEQVMNHFFRCRGFGTVHPLDSRLVDAVVSAAERFETARVEVVSAYRSPKFNDSLAKKGRHVASESKHTKGMAMDVRFVGTGAADIGKWMYENFEGGVGTYIADDFVHIDTGPKRRWRGR